MRLKADPAFLALLRAIPRSPPRRFTPTDTDSGPQKDRWVYESGRQAGVDYVLALLGLERSDNRE